MKIPVVLKPPVAETGTKETATKKKTSSKKSYTDWLFENGILSDDIYHNSVKNAETDYQKAKAEYGSRAESLASSGLSKSGYSDYLSAKAYEVLQRERKDASLEYRRNERQNKTNYASYVSALEDAESKLFTSVGNDIVKKRILGYSDAYDYAVDAGLSESLAEKVASSATKTVLADIKTEIGKLIINKKLSQSETKAYARFMGLSEADANELGEFAKKYNYVYTTGEAYLDYIKDKLKGTEQ